MQRFIRESIFVLKNHGSKAFILRVIKFPINRLKLLKQEALYKISYIKAYNNPEKVIHLLKSFNSSNPEEVINFAWSFYGDLIRPIQFRGEFTELLKIFQELNPRYIMEIGTAKGGTLFCFCKLARDDATIISIDLPDGPFGGGYPAWKVTIYQAFKKESQKLYLLREDSHKQETLEKVKEILGQNRLDFLFIDGDHSYEGVKKDFEMYSPLVRKGGIIAFHDIAAYIEKGKFVGDFWNEVKSNYKYREIIKGQKWGGIGIIYLP